MSNKRVQWFFVFTWFFMLLIILLSLFVYVVDDRAAGSQGSQGPKGDPAVVDYSKIEAYVDAKVDALPKAKDGKDGEDGKDGKDGYAPVKGVDYFDGKDGTNGLNGDSPQMRCNAETGMREWKLSKDDFWEVLDRCVLDGLPQ